MLTGRCKYMVCQWTEKLESLLIRNSRSFISLFFQTFHLSSASNTFSRYTCVESTKSYSTGFRVCGQALDSIITQSAGWQPTSPSLTWLPPWPLPNVINIPNQWRKQGGSGRGHEHDLLAGFKQLVILCLHLSLTCTSDGVSSARDGRRSASSNQTALQNVSILLNIHLKLPKTSANWLR